MPRVAHASNTKEPPVNDRSAQCRCARHRASQIAPRRWAIAALAALLAPAGAALGQDAAPAPARAPDPATSAAAPQSGPTALDTTVRSWTIRTQPYAWYVGPSGDVKIGGAGGNRAKLDVDDAGLDSPRLSPGGQLDVNFGQKWRLSVGGFHYESGDDTGVATNSGGVGDFTVSAGDVIQSKLEFWSVQAAMGYQFVHRALGTMQSGDPRILFDLEGFAGLRVMDAQFDINFRSGAASGNSTSASDTFYEPMIGIRSEAEFARQFTMDLQSSFGTGPWGSTSSWSWDIMVGGTWRPFENVGVRIGYRQLAFDLDSGDGSGGLQYRGALAGLLIGIELRF